MKKAIILFVITFFTAIPLIGQETAEDLFSSTVDRCNVLIEIARVKAPPIEFSKNEKEQFLQIVELVKDGKSNKALENWKIFREGFGERWFIPDAAGNIINYLLHNVLLETNKELLRQVDEITVLNAEDEKQKTKYEELYSDLIKSQQVKNAQYELVSRIMKIYNTLWKLGP